MIPKRISTSNSLKFNKSSKSSSISLVTIISWILTLFWLLLLIVSWKSGLLSSKHQETQESQENAVYKPIEAYENSDLHIIFSTDCNPFQDWQTLVLFHSATLVHQQGSITRIASGCNEEKKVYLTELYKRLYPHYHVHFTPDFKTDTKTKRKCLLGCVRMFGCYFLAML